MVPAELSSSTLALVATTRYLLLVNLDTGRVISLENHRPEYYGITWQPNSKNLILSHSGLDNGSLVDVSTYAQSEVGWISCGAVASTNFLSQPHQILFATDNRVVCSNTGRNVVTAISLTKPSQFHEASISPARWDILSLSNIIGDHINSVYEKNGVLHVIAHRHSKGSALAIFSYPDLQLIELKEINNRSGLHNIWVNDDGQHISCHSEAGAVIDLVTNEVLWEAGSAVYTRGLAATSQFLVVGESQKTGRDLRASSMSGLWIIDRKTWKAMDYLCLGPYGAVNEVRLLNVADEAHHGHPFAGTADLLNQDLHLSIKSQRLAATHASKVNSTFWKDFDLVFGAPVSDTRGFKYADGENLSLMVQKSQPNQNEPTLKFSYALDLTAAQSHVSCVIDYKGHGADANMMALLIQPAGAEARLSLWRQDGSTWSVVAGVSASHLPIAGNIIMTINDTLIDLTINATNVLSYPKEQLHLQNGMLGIRWIGAHIKHESEVI